MRTVLKKVYYCDFCKKKGLSASSISKHEKHCTLNPKRECRLCKNYSLKEDECPICEFSKMRLSGTIPNDYSLKKEMEVFWSQQREEEQRWICLVL